MPVKIVPDPFYRLQQKAGVQTNYLNSGYTLLANWREGNLTKSWDNTANYFAIKKAGGRLPTNTFLVTAETRQRAFGRFTRFPTNDPKVWTTVDGLLLADDYTDWGFSPSTVSRVTDGMVSTSDNVTANSILKDIKEQSVNLGQVFTERKQTIRLVGDTIARIAMAATRLKKGDLHGAVNLLVPGTNPSRRLVEKFYKLDVRKRLSQGWLELQYGWKPLYQDVHGAAEFIAHAQNRVYHKDIKRTNSVHRANVSLQKLGFSDQITLTHTNNATYTNKRHYRYTVTDTAAKTLAEAGISNPATLAWELLPWSFVVDWFIPIGNFIDNINATAGCTFDSGTLSYRYVNRVDSEGWGTSGTGIHGHWTYAGSGTSFSLKEEVGRVRLSDFPSNPTPQLKNPISSFHVFNALALLTLAFK